MTTIIENLPDAEAVSSADTTPAPDGAVRGKIVLLRPGAQEFLLREGSFTIGRSEDNPCDINIQGDPGISRCSAQIDVTNNGGNVFYKLTALNATNPVLHNYAVLPAGRSVMLNYGDTITLGKTKLRFDRI